MSPVCALTLGMAWLTSIQGSMSMLLFSAMIFTVGFGLGLVMQTIVPAVQNSVDPHEIGTATSANNFFREIGAAVGTALFSTIFVNRLGDNLASVIPAGTPIGQGSATSLTPAPVAALPEPLHSGIVGAYTQALAPAFWYLVPILVVGLVLALFLREVPLSTEAGMVSRGEAVADGWSAARSSADGAPAEPAVRESDDDAAAGSSRQDVVEVGR